MSSPSASDQPTDQLSFEDALKRLEEIVHALEEGELGLSDALERYAEGVKLLRQSYELLQRAERKIELLSGIDAEGNPITQPFDDTATFKVGQVGNLPNDQSATGRHRSRRRAASNPPPADGGIEPLTGEIGMDDL
jgi:exodeoxyribonuclease VII small subunit